MNQYVQHPLSAAFPPMSDEDYSALKADLAANGQRHPAIAITDEDGTMSVLDGWHRVQACMDLGIKPMVVEFSETADPVAFVISANLHRRHLSASQRAQAIVACNEWVPSGREKPIFTEVDEVQEDATPSRTSDPRPPSGRTPVPARELASRAHVSTRTVERAKQVQREAPEVAKEVIAGKKTLNEAVREIRPQPERAAERVVKEIPKQSEVEKLHAEIARLNQKIADLQESLAEMTDAAEILAGIEEGKDTIELLKAAKAYSRAVERTRDDLQRENAKLINEVKALRRKYEPRD